MAIHHLLELVPFSTPNYVLAKLPPAPRQDGLKEAPKFNLTELEPSTLSKLCDEFRAEIFAKAKKDDPAKLLESLPHSHGGKLL